jgi:hypothetical protein
MDGLGPQSGEVNIPPPLEPKVPTIFTIPEDLTVFTESALTQMCDTAVTEHNALFSSMDADKSLQTSENLDRLDALKKFTEDAATEVSGRGAAAGRMANHATLSSKMAAKAEEDAEGEAPSDDNAAEEATESEDSATPKSKGKSNYSSTPRVGDVAKNAPKSEADPSQRPTVETFGKMFAASNVEGFAAGQELKDIDALSKAFLAKVKTFPALSALRGTASEPIPYPVATLTRDYPKEFSVNGTDEDDDILRNVINEKRLPGGSLAKAAQLSYDKLTDNGNNPDPLALVAATGWCAPSETLYDTCFQGSNDGLYDAPEVQARRGGIRHNQGIDFTGVFGGGTGFFNLTEAQVIAGTTKTCVEIPCPSFVDDRLGVTGLCITGNILQNRGYPEFVRDWTRAAMIASAHQINSLQIAAVVSGSTAVDLTAAGAATFVSDGSVTSQLLAAVEMAIVDIKYRLRMERGATLEVVFPWWVLAQFRADLSRQNGGDALARQYVSDAQITSWFSSRGARVQWVYDWQDAFAPADVLGGAGLAPGNATPIVNFPTGVKFLVYPTGTWVRAVNDVITLNAIYDSTKLATNQNTQLFTETGWAMMRMCPVSRVYTVGICPTGSTGDQRAVACS